MQVSYKKVHQDETEGEMLIVRYLADGTWYNVRSHPATKVIEEGRFCEKCGQAIPSKSSHNCGSDWVMETNGDFKSTTYHEPGKMFRGIYYVSKSD